MADRLEVPATHSEAYRALRNTGAAIRLQAEGHQDEAVMMLAEADVVVSRSLLIALLCEYATAAGADPRDIADGLIFSAERHLLEGQNND